MRGLKALVIVMGVLIVVGTATLGVLIVHRLGTASGGGLPTAGAVPGVLGGEVLLDEPAGTRIATVFGLGSRLVVQLQGGGPDRVLLIDPATGTAGLRIRLAR